MLTPRQPWPVVVFVVVKRGRVVFVRAVREKPAESLHLHGSPVPAALAALPVQARLALRARMVPASLSFSLDPPCHLLMRKAVWSSVELTGLRSLLDDRARHRCVSHIFVWRLEIR
jgi:hypothetical protein